MKALSEEKYSKKVYGIGINDMPDGWTSCCDGSYKQHKKKEYIIWQNMLKRCYSIKFHTKNPTYKVCTICDAWLTLSNFISWLKMQDYEGKEIDKDIIHPGNKVYGPNTCCFITPAENCLLTNHEAKRGKYPQGVCWHKRDKKFNARISIDGKRKHLGYFNTVKKAEAAYKLAKYLVIYDVAMKQVDPRIRAGFLRHAITYKSGKT